MKIKKLTLIPDRLQRIASPPKKLYVLGPLDELLQGPTITIVGARRVSPYGREVTRELTTELAELGVTVVSGLALGVDSIAHQAAVDVGGKTIAVLPCGLDTIYPASHRDLALKILKSGGALVSEYPEKSEPFPVNFIARNRLVAGLGDAVLVTEAAEKSGTLHTANFALDQGKTVMAVPGNITSQLSVGTNNLLKAGASFITSTADILDGLGLTLTTNAKNRPVGANEAENRLLEMVAAGTNDSEILLAASGLSAQEFNQTLTMLEISGKIKAAGAGHWSLA